MRKEVYPHPEVAKRIQQVFWDNDLIDREVAEAIGMERKVIGKYRNCTTNPSIKFIRYICSTYHVSADWLLALREEK